MVLVIFIVAGLLASVHCSDIHESTDGCVTISNKPSCKVNNITCKQGNIVVTCIKFGTINNNSPHCTKCLDQLPCNTINITSQHRITVNDVLERCSFQQSCSLQHFDFDPEVVSIRNRCISEQYTINPCVGQSHVLNIGDQHHIVLRSSSQSGSCSCVIDGLTELKIQDFFTTICHSIFSDCVVSESVLLMDGIVYSNKNFTYIVHSNVSHRNVSNLIINFDKIFQRIWLSVDVKENGTRIWCINSVSSSYSSSTTDVTIGTTSSSAYTSTEVTGFDPITNKTSVSTNATYTTVIYTSAVKETSPISFPWPTSSETYSPASGPWNTTYVLGTAKSRTSIIVYVTSVSSAVVVVVLIFVGIIAVIRYKRRNNPVKSTRVTENCASMGKRSSSESLGFENLAMQSSVNNEYECQTVANIPHITKGSIKYAVAVPTGTYNYVITEYDRDASQKFRSKLEPTGSSKSDAKVANGEEDLCHPYFHLRPLNQKGIGETTDFCTDEGSILGAGGDMMTAQPIHVYNHITFGRGSTEVHKESGLIRSDEYSHITIGDVKASDNGQYYNIVNTTSGGSEPADNYCHIAQNNTNTHARVPRDDYNHVVL